MSSLIAPTETWVLWALIVSGTAASIWMEQRYKWAARLSGPVLALLIAMVLSNTQVMPTQSPAYDFIELYLVPLAIPLLLFRANLLQIIRSTGRMFFAFHLSAIGTLIGTVVAFLALRGLIPFAHPEHAAGMMAASYIGGSVNFMAIKTSYSVQPELADPLIVADNFVMAAMFAMLLGIAASRFFRRHFPHPHSEEGDSGQNGTLAARHWDRKGIGLLDLAKSLAVAFAVVAFAKWTENLMRAAFGETTQASLPLQMLQVLCTNKFVLITLVSLTISTVFHKTLSSVAGPEELGTIMLYLFLFSIGLPADLKAVLLQAPMFFVFCAIIATVNLAVTLMLGKMFRLNLEDLLVVVNANLGGAPSAAAMAISAGWPRLVLPGILVGIWGYVVGTPLGIMVIELLKR